MRSRHNIIPEENRDQPPIEIETPPIHIPPPVIDTEIKQGEETDQRKDHEELIVISPPFSERLMIPKPIVYLDFNLAGELKNICIKIFSSRPFRTFPSMLKQLNSYV